METTQALWKVNIWFKRAVMGMDGGLQESETENHQELSFPPIRQSQFEDWWG